MSIIDKLKQESLRLRRERDPIASSITFALSEIERVGKNAGNRMTTEDEAVRVIQKLIATVDENMKVTTDDSRKIAFNYEKQILQSVLPQMAGDEQILVFLREQFTGQSKDAAPKKSDVMRAARVQFGALVDMKRLGQLMQEVYGV